MSRAGVGFGPGFTNAFVDVAGEIVAVLVQGHDDLAAVDLLIREMDRARAALDRLERRLERKRVRMVENPNTESE